MITVAETGETVTFFLNQSSAEYFDYWGEGSFVDSFASSPLLSGD